MKIKVLWVGKSRDPWVKDAIDEYAGRIRRYMPLELIDIRDEKGAEAEEMRRREAARVTPRFDSVRFGAPVYGRLAGTAAAELTRGAHDEGELGSYHEWWLAYRAGSCGPAWPLTRR